jgi:hypothetical protein
MRDIKKIISKNLLNIPGSRISQKIVVIESDDWGTIRMSSKEAYNALLSKGYPVDKCPYNKFDSLESNEDLVQLYEVLKSVRGGDNKPAILTANNIVANPDFEKIRECDFKQYYNEPFTQTLKRYPNRDKVMDLYQSGITEGLIFPQFHGREHLNVKRWMSALQNFQKPEMDAFNNNVFSPKIIKSKGDINEYMDAFNFDVKSEIESQKQYIIEGLDLFNEIWGFKSESFIAPCYTWHSKLEETLKEYGVKYIQGLVNQLEPTDQKGFKRNRIYHYQGQKNKLGQRYFIRNVFFEPSTLPDFDWIGDCLHRICIAFKFNKPAIISVHRLNFMGDLNKKNREVNLRLFQELLTKITKQWPDAQFLSSDKLGQLYNN